MHIFCSWSQYKNGLILFRIIWSHTVLTMTLWLHTRTLHRPHDRVWSQTQTNTEPITSTCRQNTLHSYGTTFWSLAEFMPFALTVDILVIRERRLTPRLVGRCTFPLTCCFWRPLGRISCALIWCLIMMSKHLFKMFSSFGHSVRFDSGMTKVFSELTWPVLKSGC